VSILTKENKDLSNKLAMKKIIANAPIITTKITVNIDLDSILKNHTNKLNLN
jgi:hypothetical protein